MDGETAVELAKLGSTLLFLGVPQYTLIGIDTQMVSVGPAFKGIKMIPPGPHFVYYSSSTRDGNDFSPITGFFVHSGSSQVIVRKWDEQEERLVKLPEEEEERYCQAVRNWEFDRHLGPYNLSQYGDWKRLSNYITKSTIERIEPIGGEITVHLNLPCINTLLKRGIDGQQLTSMNLDKTQLLESVLLEDYGGSEDMLLGELQFAFVAFLMGQSLEAFLQWKSLVSLLFGCTEAPFHTRSQLFVKFIKMIHGFLLITFCIICLRNFFYFCKMPQLLMEIFCHGQGNSRRCLKAILDGNSSRTVQLMGYT
ncbi:hypothetical protein M0R45_000546 [Rubus argutus]|uniref:Protein AAR2 homolog n=1 Tax=Rubus argutus TaxID=59490 RepID=A0AAW1VPS9_RUBAR